VAQLIVQAPQNSLRRSTLIVLDKVNVETHIGESGFVERLEEKAAVVPKNCGGDEQDTRQFCREDFEARRWHFSR
jgi:hypothetical protein